MNARRRKELKKAVALLMSAQDLITAVLEEKQEAYENMPESFQESERGENMQECIDTIEYHADNIEEMIDALEEITG